MAGGGPVRQNEHARSGLETDFVDPRDEMAAYDRLPPRMRSYLSTCPISLSAREAEQHVRRYGVHAVIDSYATVVEQVITEDAI